MLVEAADYLIDANGTYLLPAGYSGRIAIKAKLTSVTIVGNGPHVDTNIEVLGPTANVKLTIQDLDITASPGRHGLTMGSTSSYELHLAGSNRVLGGTGGAGVHVPPGATLVIRDSATNPSGTIGSLVTWGGYRGAGIGGGDASASGNITIASGSVTANSGVGAAGIGGGESGGGGVTTISGGTVTAKAIEGSWSAGIGGGCCGGAGTIIISGGIVDATGDNGAGIGSGFQGAVGTIDITAGTIIATGGGGAAGIGNAERGSGVNVNISGGVVIAQGGDPGVSRPGGGSGIGGGSDGSCGVVTISGGTVTATGGESCAGIGTGVRGTGGSINISNGTVTANGSSYGAGIGSGSHNLSTSGTIAINISGGNVTASTPFGAGGIGGGYLSPDVAIVTVTGGTIIASSDGYHMRDIGYASGSNSSGLITLKNASGTNLSYMRLQVVGKRSLPLAGATITFNGVIRTTNSDGVAGFFLPMGTSSYTVSVSAPGYKDVAVGATPNEQSKRQTININAIPYTLTYSAVGNGQIRGSGGTTAGSVQEIVLHGDDGLEVEAIPDAHYHFVRWNDGVTTAKRTDLNITSNASYTALFEPNIVLEVTPGAVSRVYGGSDPAITYTLTSGTLQGGDQLTGSLARVVGVDVGSYLIEQGSLTAGHKYDIVLMEQYLTITARPVTITADSKEKTYGDVDPVLTYEITVGSLVEGDTFSGSLTRTPGEDVNEYTIQRGTVALSTNYTLTFASDKFNIIRRVLTVTADDKIKTYDALGFNAFTATFAGFAPGEDVADLTGSLQFEGAAITAKDFGVYTITPAGLSSSNYGITFEDGKLSINKKSLTVTADNKSKVYDGTSFSPFTVTYSGFVDGEDEASLTGSLSFGSAATAINIGPYTISPQGLSSENYNITFYTGDLVITKRQLTVTADPQSKTYGDEDPEFTYALTSGILVPGDDFLGMLARNEGEGVGTYAISIGGLSAGTNYDITFNPQYLDITERSITITADSSGKIYGDTDPEWTYSLTSGYLVGSDALSGALSRLPGENVESYPIMQGSLTAGGNYELTYNPASFAITPKEITITASSSTKTYGDNDPELVYGITTGPLVGTDTLRGTLSRDSGEDVGHYSINIGTLSAGENYIQTYVDAQLAITPRVITVTADALTKTYGDVDPHLTYTITEGTLVEDDVFLGTLNRDEGEDVNVYTIMRGDLTAGANYNLAFTDGSLTIAPRSLTVAVNDKQKFYDGAGYTDFTVTYTGFSPDESEADLLGELEFGGDAPTAVNAGDYTISAFGLTSLNYEVTFIQGILTISKRPLTIASDSKTKFEGQEDPEFTYRLTSGTLVGTDAISGSLSRVVGESRGQYQIMLNTVTAGPNYEIDYVHAQLSIRREPTPTVPLPTPHTLVFSSDEGVVSTLMIASENVTLSDGRTVERVTLYPEDYEVLLQGHSRNRLELAVAPSVPDALGRQPIVEFFIPGEVLESAKGMSIVLATEQGSLLLPPILIEQLAASRQDATVQIDSESADALTNQLPAGTKPLGDALVVQTALKGNTRVTIWQDLILPQNELERQAFLDSLSVFALHSNGDRENIFNLEYDIDYSSSPPVLHRITFVVDSFSKFVLVQTSSTPLKTTVGIPGYSLADTTRNMVPCYYKDRDTMMPIRMLQDFGVNFEWSEETKTAVMTFRQQTVELIIGSVNAYINGSEVPIIGASGESIAPELAPGRTMIPLRFVSEQLGFTVHWDPSNLITITLPR